MRHVIRAAIVAAALIGLFATAEPAADAGSQTRAMPDGTKIVRKIHRYQRATWAWQRLMGVPKTPTRGRFLQTRDLRYRVHVMHQWRRRAIRARVRAHNPPHELAWRCIHRYEGTWEDGWDPYWGGLQMDRSFMRHYAPRHLLRRGWANRWSPIEQMWVAERALRAGRGFYPWPHTARLCGLI
ncbi:MAG: hypothetical protein ACJ75P_09490 [Gaiellaceae bacterium]